MKMKPANIATTLTILACVGAASLFQNCSKISVSDIKDDPPADSAGNPTPGDPSDPGPTDPGGGNPKTPTIQIVANPTDVLEGQRTSVTVTFQEVENVTYSCIDKANPTVVASGAIAQSGTTASVQIDFDVHCEVKGTTVGTNQEIKAVADVTVNCANRMKNPTTNRCEDFQCDMAKAQVLPKPGPGQVLQIPARTNDRVCYYVKLMDAIDNSSSTLTQTRDTEVISRNHDLKTSRPVDQHNPYLLGKTELDFLMAGPRVVKLSGGVDPTQEIKVDNFILFGVYPAGQDISQKISQVYSVMGTSDSSISNAQGADSNSISFRNIFLPIEAFGNAGTSSVKPVDITTSAEPMILQHLDIRAQDAGGVRELSDIYLLFQ